MNSSTPIVSAFGQILLYVIAGIGLVSTMLFLAKLLRPNHPNIEKLSTYESGEAPDGNANVQFNVRFYVIALLFVLFDVELVFLFPWATVFGNTDLNLATNYAWGWFTLAEMFVFVGILALGLAYAWVKGHLDWIKPEPQVPHYQSKVPNNLYDKVNQKYGGKPND